MSRRPCFFQKKYVVLFATKSTFCLKVIDNHLFRHKSDAFMKNQKLHFIAITLISVVIMLSNSAGVSFDSTDAPGDASNCSSCHSNGSPDGQLLLTNVPLKYTPGASYTMSLQINDMNAVKGGFQIVATNGINNAQVGTFTTSSGTQVIASSGRLSHLGAKTFSAGTAAWSVTWTAPTTGYPSAVKFYYAAVAGDGIGTTEFDDAYSLSTASIPLPIELTRFDGRLNKGKVELSWETAMEKNADRFSITRSTDNRNFEQIGEVSASGDSYSKQEYQFIDERLPNASQIYYRLEEHDFDGATTQSKIITIQHNRSGVNVRFLDGNPVKVKGSVRFVLDTDQNVQTARLVSIDGRTLGQAHVEKEAEVEIFANLSGLNFAFLQLFDADQRLVHTERVLYDRWY